MENSDQHPLERQGRAPFRLAEMEKKNSFSVPEGYFDSLPARIQARAVQPRSQWNLSWPVWSVSLGCMALLIIGIWFFQTAPTENAYPSTALSQVSNQAIVTYLAESDLSQTELLETVSKSGATLTEPLFQPVPLSEKELLEQIDIQSDDDFI